MSKRTQTAKRLAGLFKLLSLIVICGPIFYFVTYALIFGNFTASQKLIITSTTACCLVLSILNLVLQVFKHSKFWIVMIGLAIVLPNIARFVIVFGVANIVNEIILEPLYRHFNAQYHINKEIDRRWSVKL